MELINMPIKILFVDNQPNFEPLIRQIFRKQIRRKEFDLIFASDGLEALDKLQTEPEIDIVLTELRIPKMDGLTLLARLKELKPGLNPVLTTVIISAYDDMENIRKAMNLGAFDFLTKPIDLQDIRVTLDKTIQHVQQLKKALEQERLAEEALRRANEELEGRVAERTAELSAANAALKNSNKQLAQEIAERKQAEEALRESEATARALLNAPTDVVALIDTKGVILDANAATAQRFGRHLDELVGRYGWDLVPPDVAECRKAYVDQVVQSGKFVRFEDGRQGTWFDNVFYPVLDAQGKVTKIALLARDITARKQTEEALRESEERYRAIFEQAADSIVLIDAETGTLVEFNDRAHEQLDYTREEFQKLKIADFEVIESAEQVARHIEKIIKQGADIFETKHRRKDGEIRDIVVSSRAIPIRGRDLVQSIWRDITEQKQAEEALRQRTAQLEAVHKVGLELTAQLDLDTLLHSITSHAMKLLGGNASGLSLYRPERDILEVTVSIGDVVVPLEGTFRRGEGFTGKVWETGEPLVVGNYPHWEGRAARYEKLPVVAAVGVPVCWGPAGAGEFLGVLNVTSDSPNVFSPADVELLSLFATQAAIALKNAQLYAQALRDAQP